MAPKEEVSMNDTDIRLDDYSALQLSQTLKAYWAQGNSLTVFQQRVFKEVCKNDENSTRRL